MKKVNIILIICILMGEYFQLVRVILKKVVTRIGHFCLFFGFDFWNSAEWKGQASEVGKVISGG